MLISGWGECLHIYNNLAPAVEEAESSSLNREAKSFSYVGARSLREENHSFPATNTSSKVYFGITLILLNAD